jgi:heme-degrading monooxygenase HmoA
MSLIAPTPTPPYYAVIFTSHRNGGDDGYAEMAAKMMALAATQPGFLGAESAREDVGITVSYWESLDAIRNWKANAEHREAQRLGRQRWYWTYRVRVARVEREYGLQPRNPSGPRP